MGFKSLRENKSGSMIVNRKELRALADKERQIDALKKQLAMFNDNLENQQDEAHKVRLELSHLQREMSAAASAKEKADMRVKELNDRLSNAENRVGSRFT
eukprot:scaffold49008_cov29-Prasinocladus_malaysianus.AAC.1